MFSNLRRSTTLSKRFLKFESRNGGAIRSASSNSPYLYCLHHQFCNLKCCNSSHNPILSKCVQKYNSSINYLWGRQIHLSSSYFQKEVIPFKLSDIGEGIKEVTIKEWFVQEGDTVAQFDQICEVQSDKASVTITSRYDGIVKKLHYNVDDIALVGSALVDIETNESSRPAEEVQEIQEGDAIQVGMSSEEESFHLPSAGSFVKTLATPAVRRIASQYKIDLKNVQGTGKEGRVLKEDVLNYINAKESGQDQVTSAPRSLLSGSSTPTPASSPPTATRTATSPTKQAPSSATSPSSLPRRTIAAPSDRTEAIKGYTRTMIKTMTAANQIPHFGYSDEIVVSELLKLRKQLKDSVAQQYNIKLTTLSLFLKSASLALTQFPILNASLDLDSNSIIYKGAHNIGVAMDTKLGLIVPNVKNVESKSILEVAEDLQNLQKCALSGAVKPDDLRGGTFSISNIGSIGGTYAHPVILPPEVAIVAIGKVQLRPRFDNNGNVIPVEIVNFSFSCDHRIIDGATASRFSNLWKSYIESPSSMLIHLK